MRQYDPGEPLIFLHIPKTAGVSAREVFHNWFGDRLFLHFGHKTKPNDLSQPPFTRMPTVLWGHFARHRGLACEQLYPTVEQFVTILRDPWEQRLSAYFFKRRRFAEIGTFPEIAETSLEQFVLQSESSLLNHFPASTNENNFAQVIENSFVEIGITEQLDESLARIGEKLGFDYIRGTVSHLNSSPRDLDIPVHVKSEFQQRNALEYAIYEYVASRFK